MESDARHQSMPAHRLSLARELLDDIEMSRLAPESLLLKASRLARLLEASEIQEWLDIELKGYLDVSVGKLVPNAIKHGLRTGRTTNLKASQPGVNINGYWQPYAGLLAWIRAMEAELQSLKVPNINYAPSSANPQEYVGGMFGTNITAAIAPVTSVMQRMQTLTAEIS